MDTNYGGFSVTNNLDATNSLVAVYNSISGLTPGTTYHYQLVGVNGAGSTPGSDLTFTTPPLIPVVATLPATSITATNATLNGTVNPGYGATAAYFQYGLDTNYGSFTATNDLVAANTSLPAFNLISGLTPGTTYHYQLVGVNGGGTTFGSDYTFITSLVQPVDFNVQGAMGLSGGAFQLIFTNRSGLSFTVLGSTNLSLPITNWTVLGNVVESPAGSGNYQFSDTNATTLPSQYYRIRSP